MVLRGSGALRAKTTHTTGGWVGGAWGQGRGGAYCAPQVCQGKLEPLW